MLWGASQLLVGWDCISNNNLKHPGRLTRKKTNQKKQKKKTHKSLLVSSQVRIMFSGLYCVHLELYKHKRLE